MLQSTMEFFIHLFIEFAIVAIENRYLYGKKILLWTLWKNNIATNTIETGRHFLIGADPSVVCLNPWQSIHIFYLFYQ